MLLLKIIETMFKREEKVPEQFMRMVRTEFKSVPEDYVENFFAQNKRLPSTEELYDAI